MNGLVDPRPRSWSAKIRSRCASRCCPAGEDVGRRAHRRVATRTARRRPALARGAPARRRGPDHALDVGRCGGRRRRAGRRRRERAGRGRARRARGARAGGPRTGDAVTRSSSSPAGDRPRPHRARPHLDRRDDGQRARPPPAEPHQLANRGVDLTRSSRAPRGAAGDRGFFLYGAGHVAEPAMGQALAALDRPCTGRASSVALAGDRGGGSTASSSLVAAPVRGQESAATTWPRGGSPHCASPRPGPSDLSRPWTGRRRAASRLARHGRDPGERREGPGHRAARPGPHPPRPPAGRGARQGARRRRRGPGHGPRQLPARRALETAGLVAPTVGLVPVPCRGPTSGRSGSLTGRTTTTRSRASRDLPRWRVGDVAARMPGGESGRDVLDRYRPALEGPAPSTRTARSADQSWRARPLVADALVGTIPTLAPTTTSTLRVRGARRARLRAGPRGVAAGGSRGLASTWTLRW